MKLKIEDCKDTKDELKEQGHMFTVKKIFFKVLSSAKVTILVAAIITMWILSCKGRSTQIATLHELIIKEQVKLSFHHDNILKHKSYHHGTPKSDESNVEELGDDKKKIEDQMKQDADQGELDKPTEEFTSLSDAFFTCLLEVISTQLFDKTFVIVIIFTIGWSGYNNDGKQVDNESHVHSDKSMHFVAKYNGSSAIRIFLTSTIGTCVTSIVSFYLYR